MVEAPDREAGPAITRSPAGRSFQIRGRLGQGSLGSVYLAEMGLPTGQKSMVALKVLHHGVSASRAVMDRVHRIAGASLPSGIRSVHGVSRVNGQVALVMDYMPGVDLQASCFASAEGRPAAGAPPLRVVLEIIREIAHILSSIPAPHGSGGLGLHGDLKPSHILLGTRGQLRLLDHGLPSVGEKGGFSGTGTHAPVGAPEASSPAGDVWCLGVLACAISRGQPLPSHPTDRVSYDAWADEAVAGLWKDRAESAGSARALVRDLLAFDSRKRPSSAAMVGLLTGILAEGDSGEPDLPTWAARSVASLRLPEERLPAGPLSGRQLAEETGSLAATEPVLEPAVQVTHVDDGPSPVFGAELGRPFASEREGMESIREGAGSRYVYLGVGIAGVLLLGVGFSLSHWLSRDTQPPVADVSAALQVDGAPVQAGPGSGEAPTTTPDNVATAPDVNSPSAAPEKIPEDAEPAADKTEQGTKSPTKETAPATDKAKTDKAKIDKAKTDKAKTDKSAKSASTTKAAKEEANPTMGTVRVAGDATEVRFVSGGKRFRAGSLSPGTYTIEVVFGDSWPKSVGSVTVVAGKTATVTCTSGSASCSVK
jgi:hypothetical protein